MQMDRKFVAAAMDHYPIDPSRVVIDHNNEETVKEVLDRGYWAAFTIYPHTKLGNERMVEIMKEYGSERIIIDSAADWGISLPRHARDWSTSSEPESRHDTP